MAVPPFPIDALGIVHFWSLPAGIWEFLRVVIRKLPFTTLSYLVLFMLSADAACLAAWLSGPDRFQDISFQSFLLLQALAAIVAFIMMLWVLRYRALQRGSLPYSISHHHKNPELTAFVAVIAIILFVGGEALIWNTFASGKACGGPRGCIAYDLLLGTHAKLYGVLTFVSFCGSGLTLVLIQTIFYICNRPADERQ